MWRPPVFSTSSEVPWLIRQIRPFWPLLVGNLAAITLGSALTLVDPLILKWMIDTAIVKRNLKLVLMGAVLFCLVYLGSMAVSYLGAFLSSLVSQKLVFRIRVSLLRHVHTLPAKFHGNVHVGETLYRIEQDVDRVAELSGDVVPTAMHMVIVGAMVLVTMTILNWHLTAIVVPLLPVFYVLQKRYIQKLKDAADRVQGQAGKINAFLQEHLAGMLQIQLLNRTSTQGRKFAHLAAEGARTQIQQRRAEITFSGAYMAIIALGMSLILGYGGHEVLRGTLTVGGLVAFYGYVVRLFEPVSIAVDLQSRLQRVGASVRRIVAIYEHREPADRVTTVALGHDVSPELEFRSVSFSYTAERPVLLEMSFRVEPGETVALVGMNGSGKSTVGLLATGLYEPDAGSIVVGGQDIREVSRRSLRATVTLVPQDPILFDESIRENLLYGNPRANGADLEAVSSLAQLDAVLRKMPRGFDEPLGPLGGRLSGGEKKRLALARTLLQQPQILIVDEITSALDAPTTMALLKGLELFRGVRTLLVISHRPATILWADRILVVDRGSIVDTGSHGDLMRRCEVYRTIWQAQDRIPIEDISTLPPPGERREIG